jgi:formylglycine-generating enzyme required for sulfatase activity
MPTKETIQDITLVTIPGGTYLMGHDYAPDPAQSDRVNVYYPDEQPVHEERVATFQLGEVPATQAQYRRLTDDNPSTFTGDDMPVTNVGPFEICAYLNALSSEAGLDPCYAENSFVCDMTKSGFRLPSEAEWEYACRAGTSTHFHTGDTEKDLDRAGWFIGNSGRRLHTVGQKERNAFGLYDMHGNVFEYTNDDWNPSMAYNMYLTDGKPRTYHYYHSMLITRGGSWFSEPSICRSAARACFCSWRNMNVSWYNGFRVARNVV